MKYFFYLLSLSLFLISCSSSRPSGYVQTSSNKTVYVRPQSSTRPNATQPRFNSKKINTTDSYIINENYEYGSEGDNYRPDAIFNQADEVIDFAKSFQGTRYKYGGTTRAGMDCSGLICTSFEQAAQISLPRSSRDMAKEGVKISLKNAAPGDLVFFRTTRSKTISHVGLVVDIKNGSLQFIHSSTSSGVIISSLDETYWKKAFVEVRRVI